MKKNKVITVVLIFSILLNIFLYLDSKSDKVEIEKVIIMNEFSDRAKEWRNFLQFVSNLPAKSIEDFPISKEESNLYWELAKSDESVIMKVSDKVDAYYSSYNEYMEFFTKFDIEYRKIVTLFKSKLPLMNKEDLITFSSSLNKSYDLFIREAIGNWSRGNGNKLDINFEPQKEKLNQVIEELTLVVEELEKAK